MIVNLFLTNTQANIYWKRKLRSPYPSNAGSPSGHCNNSCFSYYSVYSVIKTKVCDNKTLLRHIPLKKIDIFSTAFGSLIPKIRLELKNFCLLWYEK